MYCRIVVLCADEALGEFNLFVGSHVILRLSDLDEGVSKLHRPGESIKCEEAVTDHRSPSCK